MEHMNSNTDIASLQALKQQGLALLQGDRIEEAKALFEGICHINVDDAEVWYILSSIHGMAGNLAEAADCCHRVIALQPDHRLAHSNLGNVLYLQGHLDEAVKAYQFALRLDPSNAAIHSNLANSFNALGRIDEAIAHYKESIRLNPNIPAVHTNLGNMLFDHRRGLNDALACYREALRLKPDFVPALNGLGNVYGLRKIDEAIAHYEESLRLNPNVPAAHTNLGNMLLYHRRRLNDALACYQEALRLKPDFVPALNGLGNVYALQGKHDEALASYQDALRYDPDNALAHSNLLFLLCYRSDTDAATLFREHARWGEIHSRDSSSIPVHDNVPNEGKRLRIGYVSADFRNHPVGIFIEQVLAHHDKSRVEIFCYSNHGFEDDLTERLRQYADHWREIVAQSDDAVAAEIRRDGIDILVDLAGHTAGNRLLTFALKPAPIQVTWMSYVATTGLKTMDYIIANKFIIPPQDERYYVEQVVRLPHHFLCFTPPRFPIEVSALPAQFGEGITYGCFNNAAKLTPDVIATWSRILLALPDSRLYLKSDGFNDDDTKIHFQNLFAERGVHGKQIIFAGRSPRNEYLAAYHAVDIALDPFPYNGGTTTVEALWMGVPVVTLRGNRFVARMGESIMMNVGLEECVTDSEDAYVTKAIALASDLPRLAELRRGLRRQLLNSPLCDGPGFTRGLEDAYRHMWESWCQTQSNRATENR